MIGLKERDLAERLIWKGIFSPSEQTNLVRTLGSISDDDEERFFDFFNYLSEMQVDPIDAGHNYSQRDITRKLKMMRYDK